MSFISITNTFASATLIESGKVNANFADFGVGLKDGLHDISMAAGVFNDQLLIASGTTTTPGLAYKNSPTTGMYSPATDVNVFIAAGNEVGRIGSAGTWAIGVNGLVASHNVYGHTNFHDGFTIVSGVAKVASGLTITSGDLDVDGAARIRSNVTIASGGLYVDGVAKIKSAVTMTEGPLTVDGPASFKSAVTVSSGYLTVDGTASFKSAVTISSGNMFLDGYEDFKKIPTPASASAGTLKLHAETDNQFYATTEDGIRYPIGAGSGSGTKNYVTNPSGKVSTTGWTAIDGNITITSDYTTAVPRYTTTGAGLKLVSSVDEKYVYYRFLLDDVDVNKKLGLNLAVSVGVASQYRVEMWKNDAANYGGTYTEIALKTDVSGDSYFPVGDGVYQSSFDTDTVPYLELRIVHNGTDNTAAYISDVTITPDPLGQGAVVTDWVSYTPTFGNVTIGNGTSTGFWSRSGSTMSIDVALTLGSSSSITGPVTVSLPAGYTIDNSKLPKTGAYEVALGTALCRDVGVITYAASVVLNSSTTLAFITTKDAGGAVLSNSPFTFGDGDIISGKAEIPILEWANSGTFNVADVQNKARRTKTIDLTLSSPGSTAYSRGYAYVDSLGNYRLNFNFQVNTSAQAAITVTFASPTPVTFFAAGPQALACYGAGALPFLGATNENTSTIGLTKKSGDSDVSTWRVSGDVMLASKPTWFDANVETNDWQPVGFGYQVPGVSSGLVSKDGIAGRTDGVAAGTTRVGEILSARVVRGSAVSITAGNWATIASLTLTAGDWIILGGTAGFTGSTAPTAFFATITGTAASEGDTGSYVDSWFQLVAQLDLNAGDLITPLGANGRVITITEDTTYYFNARVAGSNASGYGYFVALRKS